MDDGIRGPILDEARRLLELADTDSVPVRLLGGAAIRLRVPVELPPALMRTYQDLDFMVPKGSTQEVRAFFVNAGYVSSEPFNAMRGRTRMLFFDEAHDRQVDIFVGQFEMCHALEIKERLASEPISIPLAELLLTKLQVVEINEKDVRDIITLLYGNPVVAAGGEGIDKEVVGAMCGRDWGLWRTSRGSLGTCREKLGSYDLQAADIERVGASLEELIEALDEAPKTRHWKLRARVGERKRWYELPEEVDAGGAVH
jgi:hypothetical protein